MKIRFLGTSHGAPEPGRHCQSMLIETDSGLAYIIDAGAPILDELYNIGYRAVKDPQSGDIHVGDNIKAVFVTHLHGDHIYGLPQLIELKRYAGMNFTTYLPEERGVEAITKYLSFLNGEKTIFDPDMKAYNEGVFFDDGNMKVTAFHTEHMKEMSNVAYSFLLEADGKRLFVTGDLAYECDLTDALYDIDTDLVIVEGAHPSPVVLFDMLKDRGAKKVAIVHIWPVKYPEIYTAIDKHKDIEVIIPKDGDEITV